MARTTVPPSVEGAPMDMQAELMAMQSYPLETLHQIAQSQTPPDQAAQYRSLLARKQTAGLSAAESKVLADLQELAERLAVRRDYVRAVLQWRGGTLPTAPDWLG